MSGSEPHVGAVIAAVRADRGMSARTLSIRAGLSDSVAGKVESRAMEPGLRVFARLVVELDLNDREIALLVRLAASS